MATVAIDFRNLAPLRGDLAAASESLATSEELDVETAGLLRSVAGDLADADQGEWSDLVDPYLVIELQQIGLAALLALDSGDEGIRVQGAEVALESLQDVLADISESLVISDERAAREIVVWLREHTGMANAELADLLDVSKRTVDRWVAGESEPSGADAMRLRIVARLVNQLRHSMTAYGAVLWLNRPFPELDGHAPRELLASPDSSPQLFALAARSRRSDAS